MADLIHCPSSAMVALATCNRAKGWPAPAYEFGTATPEGAVTGYYPGQLFANTETDKMYAFFGTAGANTGWVILN
jgi:hypothetical protein